MLARKLAKTFGNYFKKPQVDLVKPIADEVAFRNLWTANSEVKIPEDLPPVGDILFKGTYRKSMRISTFYEIKNDLEAVKEMMTNSLPSHLQGLKKLFSIFPYPGKWIFSELILGWSMSLTGPEYFKEDLMKDFERRQQKNRILQLCYCFENMGLALHLDSLIGTENRGKQNFLQKIMLRKMTDQKLLLAADFFHTKASRMSSLIGKVSIPQSLSLIEEEVAKAVFLKQKPNLTKEDKIEIAFLETGVKLAYGFQAASLILCGQENEAFLEESFEMGANLGVYLHLKHFNKGEDLNLERFWANFLKNHEKSKVNMPMFMAVLDHV